MSHRCGFDYPTINGASWCQVCHAFIPITTIYVMDDVFRCLLYFREKIEVSMKRT